MNFQAFRLALAAAAFLHAGAALAQPGPCALTALNLRAMSACELQKVFEGAAPGPLPCGRARGRVLLMLDAPCPRVRAALVSAAWKGKRFDPDGSFTNRWPGFYALTGFSSAAASCHDGRPCWLLEYPPETPLFGNTRDELREVRPGLYLAQLYECEPALRLRGYFLVELEP